VKVVVRLYPNHNGPPLVEIDFGYIQPTELLIEPVKLVALYGTDLGTVLKYYRKFF
jgi:hypothetical protein